MADKIVPVADGSIAVRYADQGDGSHAVVMAGPGPAATTDKMVTVADGSIAVRMRDMGDTTHAEVVTFGGPNGGTSMAKQFSFPGMGTLFSRAIDGLQMVEDFVFGSAAIPNLNNVSRAINNLTDVTTYFNALEGDNYDPVNGTVTGGTGLGTINSEPQRYRRVFDGQNHIVDSDCLRLQATLAAGTHWNSYLRGQVLTSGAGLNINAAGLTVTTAIADLTLVAGDIAAMEIGDVATAGVLGLMVITAKNQAGGTVTFEAVSSGLKAAYKGNFHVTFTKMGFSRVAADVVNGVTTSVVFLTPVPSSVVPGMFAMGIDANAGQYFNDPSSSDRAKVLSVSPDRLTVNFDAPVNFGNRSMQVANFDGLLFTPGTESGQIWSKKAYGPHRSGKRAQAIRMEITFPAQSLCAQNNASFSKAQVEAVMAASPTSLWGFWPALWLFTFREAGIIAGARNSYCELDMLELFTHVNRGNSVWTGNLHDQPYTRRKTLVNGTKGITGAWQVTAATAKELTPDATYLNITGNAGFNMHDGLKHSYGVVWDRNRVVHYFDDFAVCESSWSADSEYPMQIGMNVACGSLTAGNCANLFFPQTDAQLTGQFMKIHSLKTWEL